MPRVVSILIMGLWACCALAQDDESVVRRKTWAQVPKAATSAGGFVKVVAADVPGDSFGFRLPILQFTTRFIRDLERVYRLEMPHGSTGLAIYALDGTTNDARVIVKEDRRARGSLCTRIWLPSPGFSDLEQLRFEIGRAYFRAWIDRTADPDRRQPLGELPDWLVQGAIRAIDAETSHDDIRFVLDIWSTARFPFFPALCTDLRVAKGAAAALPGYMAAWIREKHLLKKLLERLASGEAWDGRRLAEELTGEKEPVLQDRASDERLARLTRAVLSPGRASDWDMKVFTSRLLLYPPVFDKNMGANCSSFTFDEAIGLAETNETVRMAALQKAREMPLCVLGRGDGLIAAGEAYRQFLLGVARGEKPDALRPRLDEADAKLKAILKKDEN